MGQGGKRDWEPIPVTPVSKENYRWTVRLLRRLARGAVLLVVAVLVLNSCAAAMGYGA